MEPLQPGELELYARWVSIRTRLDSVLGTQSRLAAHLGALAADGTERLNLRAVRVLRDEYGEPSDPTAEALMLFLQEHGDPAQGDVGSAPQRRPVVPPTLRCDTVRVTGENSVLEIRELDTVAAVHEAARVFDAVWPGERDSMPANILRALAHSGNYVVGIFDGEQMVGAAAGFFGPPSSRSMHSHVTGVLPEYRGRGVGRLLKQHQREWAFARDVGHITWTFDPLVARNAHFNLRVLGARVTDYLVNQYGEMSDDINRGDESDRVMVSWALAEPPTRTPSDEDVLATVPIPTDIETLRRDAPSKAAEWRLRVREDLLAHLAAGRRIGGFDDHRGYLLIGPQRS